MTAPAAHGLNRRQRQLLDEWLPAAVITRDHSWGLVGTTVLEVAHGDTTLIVKAGDDKDHHLAREIRAHRLWLNPWTSKRAAPVLLHADEDAKLLAREYLDGELVDGGTYEHDPDTYRQAGRLLARLHAQHQTIDVGFEAHANERTLGWLNQPHRLTKSTVTELHRLIGSWPQPPATVLPTHGDWQPRNWLTHNGQLSIIDFGRADLRPAATDLGRLAAKHFRANPELEMAFFDGYGDDPREPESWQRVELREAIATAVWGYQVEDHPFERQGHQLIAELLAT